MVTNRMAKAVTILIICSMLVCLLPASVCAAGTAGIEKASIVAYTGMEDTDAPLDLSTLKVGDTFAAWVTVSEVTALKAADLKIEFNPSVLEFEDLDIGVINQVIVDQGTIDQEAGTVTFAASNQNPGDYSFACLLKIKFKVVEEGSAYIRFKFGGFHKFMGGEDMEVEPDKVEDLNFDIDVDITQYTLALVGTGLTSVPSADSIAEGTEVTVTVAPAARMRIVTFTVNGVEKKSELVDNQYIFTITADTTIKVTYKDISTGGGGSGSSGGGDADKETTIPEDSPEDFEEEIPPEVPGISPRFQDVSETDWYYEAVEFAVEKGLFVGTSDNTFEPDTPMSRAMIVTVLWRMEKEPTVDSDNIFTDVADDTWYTDAVLWANANGIVLGYGEGLFGPNDNITREQMAAILYRYAEFKGYDVSGADNLVDYTDVDDVSGWALAYMEWAVGEKLITGMTATTLAPQGNATRAQVASILMRFIVNIAG